MDLSQFDTKVSANEGAWLDFRDPKDLTQPLLHDDKPIRVKLLGRDSDVFKATYAKLQNPRLREQQIRGRNAAAITTQALENENIMLIAACTLEFENVIVDGKPVTTEDAVAFFKRFPSFREQADDFIGGRENFMKAS